MIRLHPVAVALLIAAVFACASCGYTSVADRDAELASADSVRELNNFQSAGDSLFVPGYYYRYDFKAVGDLDRSADWILANLSHYEIRWQDAWFILTDTTQRRQPYHNATIIPPGMIVILKTDNAAIVEHHFQKCAPRPRAYFNGWTHFAGNDTT